MSWFLGILRKHWRRQDAPPQPLSVENAQLAEQQRLRLIAEGTAKDLERANAELLRSNEELSQFAYIASHDLQEPLRMVTSYLRLLERRYGSELDSTALEFLHYAVDASNRMKILIEDLLRLSRAGTQAVEWHGIAAAFLVQNAVANLKATIEENRAIVTWDALPEITGDPSLLTQVLQNLTGNGIKFHRPGALPQVHISAKRAAADWVFSVRDNGIGIDRQHEDKIFRIFERLNSGVGYPGSGVGLAITKRIIERHGGRIWVESTPGKGSTFYFSIPVLEMGGQAAHKTAAG